MVVAVSGALASCIKENRDKCPCYLHVDLSRVDSHYVHKMDLMMADRISGSADWYAVEKKLIGDTLIMKVDKSEFDFTAWGNLENSYLDDASRTITSSEPTDSLWSFYKQISTRCEDAYVKVEPERQYIPVTVIVRGMLQGISDIRPTLEFISGSLLYGGVATGDKGPLLPVLVHTPSDDASYYMYQTMILTQVSATEATLNLHFVKNGNSVDASYPVGEMLVELGEDISATNQNPIVIDLAIGTADILLTIKVSDWSRHGIYTITY